jgi:hypothetical protein
MKSTITSASLLLAFLLISTGASASTAPATDNLDSLGTAEGNGEETANLLAEVHQVDRSQSGNLVTVTWSIRNNGDERESIRFTDRTYSYGGQYFSGVTAMDTEENTRYHPLMDGSGACLCSGNTSNEIQIGLQPDEQYSYWSAYPIPNGVENISVDIPGFELIEDIPIS